MGKLQEVEELLSHLALFEGMKPDVRCELAQAAVKLRVQKNDMILHRGEQARGLYVLVIGQVKISIPSQQREKVIEFIGPGQAFGEAVMFLDHPYLINAQALSDSLLLWIDKRDIELAIEKDSRFGLQLLKGLSQRFETLLLDIEEVNLKTAVERVAGYLLNQPYEGDETVLKFNKRMIASKLGLTPETFSRALNQLTQSHLISVHGSKVQMHERAEMLSGQASGTSGADPSSGPATSCHAMTNRVDRRLHAV